MAERRRAVDREEETRLGDLVDQVATLANETQAQGERFDRFHKAMWGNSQPGFVKSTETRIGDLETYQEVQEALSTERDKRETWKFTILGIVISALVLAANFLL